MIGELEFESYDALEFGFLLKKLFEAIRYLISGPRS